MVDQSTLDHAIDTLKEGATAAYGVLKEVAPEVWKLSVKQVYIDGIECLIGTILSAAAFLACIHYAKVLYAIGAAKRDSYDDGFKPGGVTLGIVGGIISIGIFVITLLNGLDFLLNPEYWAIMRLLAQLHSRGGN